MNDNPAIPGGEFAGRYTIERELGRGGAAIVYLAHDNRQDRQVAIKVLHRELGQAIGAQRFLREIKHSSALHHPHLLAIHESGEADGFLYYVMPYMRDGSLRARIAKEKQLGVDESLRITRQVGESLAYAHSRGIVHRDIKPDNVLFSADHACLADFGIARAVDSVASDTLTSTGLVVGTPAYMSPEQASGEREVDARSDQYSLACLLYEMITGLPPFIGATQQSVISQRFTQPPPSMRAHRPSVPDHVERAVKRALAVAPADRFGSVKDFIAALHDPTAVPEPLSVHAIRRRWFAVGAAAAIAAVAVIAARPGSEWVRTLRGATVDTSRFVVLPFAAPSADDSASADVARSLARSLDRWAGISVVDEARARDALGNDRANGPSLEEAIGVARKLGAGRLVWGRIAREAGGAWINAALYDVRAGTSIRDTVYTMPADGPSASADSSLRRILNALLLPSTFPTGFDDGQDGTASYGAWQAYLRGITQLNRGDFDGAERQLSTAVETDSRFAVANVWLAYARSVVSPSAQHDWAPIAGRALTMRDRLRPRDAARAEALFALGKNDHDRACSAFRSLVQSDSLDALAWVSLGDCLIADQRVLRDSRSSTGWRFRSSWHQGGQALLRALELEPRLHSQALFTRLRKVYTPSLNQLRTGVHVATDTVNMYAYPLADGDTLAFVPHSAEALRTGRARVDPAAHTRMIDRNRATLLRVAQSWVSAAPHSGDAFEALAGVLETHGNLTGQDAKSSALASIQRARELSRGAKAIPLAGMHVRLLLRAEQFSGARSLADSLLGVLRASENHAPLQGTISALVGRPSGMVKGIMVQQYGDLVTLEAPLIHSAAEFLSNAAVGVCSERLSEGEKRVERLLASYVAPDKMAAVRRRLVNDALSLSASCSDATSALRAESPLALIVHMQQQFARRNPTAVRAGFDSLARMRRGWRASQTSPDHLIREAWLRAAIGDTAVAAQRLDAVLNALPALSAATLDNAVQMGSLIRAMALRADLAAARGERDVAKRWAAAVHTLWANADPSLGPTIERMRNLTR